MFRSLFTAASGMIAQQLNLDNIANNLANSGTSGFRRRRLQFQDTLYQNLVMPGSAATQQTNVAAGLQIGLGTRSVASEIIQAQGDFNQTGNPLDLTIQGQGFFQVTLPSGETAYTRSGAFHLSAEGNIVTADGNPIDPAITIPHRCHRHQHWGRWHRHRHTDRPNSGATGRKYSISDVPQSRRIEQHRRQLVPRDHFLRRSCYRHARRKRRTG